LKLLTWSAWYFRDDSTDIRENEIFNQPLREFADHKPADKNSSADAQAVNRCGPEVRSDQRSVQQ